jgi:methylenetetrahydrofolate dehydrogenase (NADP+) / methenyltetrahydrofolate cyclohydrolase
MILSGRKLATSICKSIKKEVKREIKRTGNTPGLGIVLVGDNPASKIYVNMKKKACQKVGFQYTQVNLSSNSSESDVIRHINYFNYSNDMHGIMVQLPLPDHLNTRTILDKVLVNKDVDCFHTENFGKLSLSVNEDNNKDNKIIQTDGILPCTPRGIMTILDKYNIDIKGKNVTIIGASNIVGLPISLLLLKRGATISICHIDTQDFREFTRNADIVVVATGNPNLIKNKDIKKDAIVIDVGINRLESGEIVGDVDYKDVKNKVFAITPVPGGVGPITIAMVLQNTLELYKAQVYKDDSFHLI